MKTFQPSIWLALIIAGAFLDSFAAEETAIVTENRINVRGQASLFGEVITQLQKGDKVTILEEMTLAKPRPDEPAKWLRIQMPANTPVWVFATFIDSANKTVNVPRLNLRAGPGENYSVVGRLEKGDTVKEIRTVDEWMEIETPRGAYAFVAANLLARSQANAAPNVLEKPAPPSVAAETQQPRATDIRPVPPAESTQPPKAEIVTPPVISTPPPIIPNAPTNAAPAVAPAVTNTEVSTQPPPQSDETAKTAASSTTPEPVPKRIVRREGVVRSTKSIQAPTYFELVSPETRKVINYLHADEVGISLKDFKGKKIVVTGEENIDSRWPKTPLIQIDTIELSP